MKRSRQTEYGILIGLIVVALILITGGLVGDREADWRDKATEIFSKLGYAVLVAATVRIVTVIFQSPGSSAQDRYVEFEQAGIVRARESLRNDDMKNRFSKAKSIQVRKTWFPENRTLEQGLIEALAAGAKIDLVLANPDCELLKKRSVGAHCDENHGGTTIRNSLRRICNQAESMHAKGDILVRFYSGWPGVPVIRFDETLLIGFYPLGNSSPDWPWLEVDATSRLGRNLISQHDEPGPAATSSFDFELKGRGEILDWLDG